MKELSIFVDESCDFGETDDKQSYYIVSFVFHDQGNDISEEVKHLEKSITLDTLLCDAEDAFERFAGAENAEHWIV